MASSDDDERRALREEVRAAREESRALREENQLLRSATAAMTAATSALAAAAARAEPARSTKTLGDLFELYRASWKNESWACQLGGALKPALRTMGTRIADELTRADWVHWRDNLRANEITVRKSNPTAFTLNQEFKRWRSAYRWGKAEGHVLTNPLVDVKPKRGAKKHRHTRPTEDEVIRILLACSPRQRAFVVLAARTGMRATEVRTMRWASVDLDGGRAKVEWQIAKARRERIVPLTSDCVLALRVIKPDIPPRYIFESPRFRGHPISDSAMWAEFRRTVDPLGIEAASGDGRVVFHDLRHTFASWAAEKLPLPVVAAIGGWSDLRTMGRYIQVTEGQLDEALGTLESSVRKKPKRARAPEVDITERVSIPPVTTR